MTHEFVAFEKIPRLKRACVITEKIDGTNACVYIADDGTMLFGSRSRWITPEDDNHGFARWADAHRDELAKLGPGRHFGEWWGPGIQRRYGVAEKRFSLFNSGRWSNDAERPACCHVVPVLYAGPFTTDAVDEAVARLRVMGSAASPGFMRPEGVVVFMTASRTLHKVTLDKDDEPKGLVAA